MINLILRLATGLRAAVAVAALAIGGTLLFRLSPYDELKDLLGGASLPEETITSPERFAGILETLGTAGRASYLQFQTWDVINPILIGGAGAFVLGWLLNAGGRGSSAWRFVLLLPICLLAADLLENVIISVGLGAYPDRAAVGFALPIVTAVKFGAAMGTMLMVASLAVLWVRDRFVMRSAQ